MTLRIPPLPPVQPPWGEFQVYWQQTIGAIVDAVNAVADAQAAADAANAAAAAADAAATAAGTAAGNAQTAADDVTAAQELGSSYVSGATISATDAGADVTITISAHTRHYPQPDGTALPVAVNGGSLTARAYSTTYYIYYDDPARTGGAVSYQSTTNEATAAQIGDRHIVGGILTPAAAAPDTGGAYTRPPGTGTISRDEIVP